MDAKRNFVEFKLAHFQIDCTNILNIEFVMIGVCGWPHKTNSFTGWILQTNILTVRYGNVLVEKP